MKKLLAGGFILGGMMAVVYAQSGPSYDNAPAMIALNSDSGSAPYAAIETAGSSGQSYDNAQPVLMLGRNANGKYYVCGAANPCGAAGGGGTIASTLNLLAGDNAGNAVSGGFLASDVVRKSQANVFTNATGNTFGVQGGSQITTVYGVAGGSGRFRMTDGSLVWDLYPNNIQVNGNFTTYVTSANYQAWATNFVERMRVSATGGVTVGDGTFAGSDPGVNNLWIQGNTKTATLSTATNCSSAAAPAVCGSAAAGSVVVAAAATTVVVNTTAVTANSQILLTQDSSLGTKLSVTCNTTANLAFASARTAGTSFTVTSTAPITNPLCLSYSIIN